MSTTWTVGQTKIRVHGGPPYLWLGSHSQKLLEAEGWTAVPEPAPVERKLGCHPRCGIITSAEYDADGSLRGGRWCKAKTDTWSDDTPLFCAADCSNREARERALDAPLVEPPAPAKPAPVVEVPRAQCEWDMHCSGTTSVRVMTWRGRPARVTLCDEHYVKGADMTGGAWAKEQTGVATGLQARPLAPPPGLVPQSFGDERLGGIWASRGMRAPR